jgi:molecular chaperone GrpE
MSDEQREETQPSEEAIPIGEEALRLEMQRLRSELSEVKEKYLRSMAESENRQKRMVREQRESIRHAVADAVISFLQPLDHMENALKFLEQSSDEVRNWATGFEMILGHFKEALSSQGIIEFDSKGQAFDPHRHEAVEAIETSDLPEGVVMEELHKGYEMEGRVLRPAKVKVSRAPEEEKAENEQNESEGELS